ncbi:MAG: tetratricopeptide repeat protein [candidate division WOR-3 bacterium]|nr:tetratricopeptide repeat protein [candidate division WOR-3 bacterium]MCX7757772.1 tetratricopeptide repeat protein [candidate division WOR-3 bacterium]MDW7988074.1 tetratricopeptide repeat protein [candidate division WOR-3 bacterium]
MKSDDKNYGTAYKEARYFNRRGVYYFKRGAFKKACAHFTKGLEILPDWSMLYSNRGYAYLKEGKFEKAIMDFSRAIDLEPDEADYYTNRGVAYNLLEKYEEAIKDFTKAIELNPNFAVAMANLGLTYAQKGDKERARYWCEQALKRKKKLPLELALLVKIYMNDL